MYDELVKRLWECASGECFNCSQYTETTNASVCSKELMKQAADAIEELQKENESLARSVNEAAEILRTRKPKWVSVEDRMPKIGEFVLVCFKNNDMAVAKIFAHDENFIFWRALTDEGWEADCDNEPTHWMPLPEPPKEET